MALTQTATAAVGANVRAELARRSLTQDDLARHLGLPQPAVSRRIRGLTPWTVDELVSAAEFFDVAPVVLLTAVAA